jgi:hypothetical protein
MGDIESHSPISPRDLLKLKGKVIDVLITEPLASGGFVPFGELMKNALVTAVTKLSKGQTRICPRCEQPARLFLTVVWEEGYQSPSGNVVCNECVCGLVTKGAELIQFPDPKRASEL